MAFLVEQYNFKIEHLLYLNCLEEVPVLEVGDTLVVPLDSMPNGMQAVLVPNRTLPEGTTITEDMLMTVFWPQEQLPDQVIVDDIAGRVLLSDIRQWEFFYPYHLLLDADTPMNLTENRVAFILPIHTRTAVFLRPGDVVDIYGMVQVVDEDCLPLTASEDLVDCVVESTQATLATSARILVASSMHGQNFGDGSMDGILLEVDVEDAEVISWAVEAGIPLTFSLVIEDTP
jgi:Flp pilus assembly protein CpaB